MSTLDAQVNLLGGIVPLKPLFDDGIRFLKRKSDPVIAIPRSNIDPKPIQQGGIPIIMGVATPSAIKRAARIADGLNPLAMSQEMLAGTVNASRSAAQDAYIDNLGRLQPVVRA